MKQHALTGRPGVTVAVAARRGLARWRQGGLGEPAAYLLLAGLVLSVLLLTDRGMLAPDTKPHLYLDPMGTLRDALETWRPNPYLGQPNFDAGLAPAIAAARARLGLVVLLFALAAIGWWSTVDRMRGMDDGPWTALGALGFPAHNAGSCLYFYDTEIARGNITIRSTSIFAKRPAQ